MTRIDKLYAQLLQSTDRTVAFRDFLALIEAFGFSHQRTKGSHRSYANPDCQKGKTRNAIKFGNCLL